jgi:hypothetical protein
MGLLKTKKSQKQNCELKLQAESDDEGAQDRIGSLFKLHDAKPNFEFLSWQSTLKHPLSRNVSKEEALASLEPALVMGLVALLETALAL